MKFCRLLQSTLGAIRYEDFKIHIKAAHGGLPGMDFYNIRRDPGKSTDSSILASML